LGIDRDGPLFAFVQDKKKTEGRRAREPAGSKKPDSPGPGRKARRAPQPTRQKSTRPGMTKKGRKNADAERKISGRGKKKKHDGGRRRQRRAPGHQQNTTRGKIIGH